MGLFYFLAFCVMTLIAMNAIAIAFIAHQGLSHRQTNKGDKKRTEASNEQIPPVH